MIISVVLSYSHLKQSCWRHFIGKAIIMHNVCQHFTLTALSILTVRLAMPHSRFVIFHKNCNFESVFIKDFSTELNIH